MEFRLDEFEDQSNGRTVDPARADAEARSDAAALERTVVLDSGHAWVGPPSTSRRPTPRALFFPTTFKAVGLGLGTAFGAAIARPDRLTVLTPEMAGS